MLAYLDHGTSLTISKEPSGLELGFIVANYVACLPVLVAVGVFRWLLDHAKNHWYLTRIPAYIISTVC